MIALFLKSHVDTFTRKNGSVVNAHDDKRTKKSLPPQKHLEQMESSLANDESSSDDEMHEFFTKECGIHPDHSKAAIKHRGHFLSTAITAPGTLKERMSKDE